MYCNNNCRLCNRLVISTAVAVVGTDLVISIPQANYGNGCRYCIVVAQSIPDTATINMPVYVAIGTDTTTLYPLTRCDCAQVTACAIRTRTRYPVIVSTNATSATFKVLKNLSCAPNNALSSVPAPTAPAPTVQAAAVLTNEDLETMGDSRNVSKTVTTKTVLKKE